MSSPVVGQRTRKLPRHLCLEEELKQQRWNRSQSGVAFDDDHYGWRSDGPVAFSLDEGRCFHASVILSSEDLKLEESNENNPHNECMVVMGGRLANGLSCNSVGFLSDPIGSSTQEPEWRQGPPMNESRSGLASVVVNGVLYAIGGRNESHIPLDTIESIPLPQLMAHTKKENSDNGTTMRTSSSWLLLQKYLEQEDINGWKTLEWCRLSCPRGDGCMAVVVHDRFIVVLGGTDHDGDTVDVIDTLTNQVYPGPALNFIRSYGGAQVVGDQIWVLGGTSQHSCCLDTVESIQFHLGEDERNDNKSTSLLCFSSSSWTLHQNLTLSTARWGHGCARLGLTMCIVVAGGQDKSDARLRSVEVLDTQRGVIWSLPDMSVARNGCTLASLSRMKLLVLGGWHHGITYESIESLPFAELSWSGLQAQRQVLDKSKHYLQQQLEAMVATGNTEDVAALSSMLQARHNTVVSRQELVNRLWNTRLFNCLVRQEGAVVVHQRHVFRGLDQVAQPQPEEKDEGQTTKQHRHSFTLYGFYRPFLLDTMCWRRSSVNDWDILH